MRIRGPKIEYYRPSQVNELNQHSNIITRSLITHSTGSIVNCQKEKQNHVHKTNFLSCVINLVPTIQKKRSLSAYNN